MHSLHCFVLHYTFFHFTELNFTKLYCTALHCTTLTWLSLHCTVLHYTALDYPTLYCNAGRIMSNLYSYWYSLSSVPHYLVFSVCSISGHLLGSKKVLRAMMTQCMTKMSSVLRLFGSFCSMLLQQNILRVLWFRHLHEVQAPTLQM